MKYVILGKICEYTGFLWYAFSCIWHLILFIQEKIWLRENIHIYLSYRCPTESMGNHRHNILLLCTCKILCMKHQTCYTDIFLFISCRHKKHLCSVISGSVTIHLLGINTESTEFQPNSTGFKLVSGADIRLEQIKAT